MNEIVAIKKGLADLGFSLERFVARTRYARNGNLGNASKEYTWVLKLNGKVVGMSGTKRGAMKLAEEF